MCVLTAGGESSQSAEKSSVDTAPTAVTISHQVEAQLQLVVEVVLAIILLQADSASYPQLDRKWVVAYGLWGKGLVRLIGVVVCLLAADCGSICSLMQAIDGCIVHCGIISSCQSAATFEIVKCIWPWFCLIKKSYSKYWTLLFSTF